MEYKSLQKKFFFDKNFNETYLKLFDNPSTLKFNICINENQMFLNVNSELLNLVEQIGLINRKIERSVYQNPNLPIVASKWLIENTLVEEIRMSNEMEGVTSTRKQIKDLMEIKKPKRYKRFYGMVNKYRELAKKAELFKVETSADIRTLYDKILLLDIEREDPSNVPDGKLFRKDAVEVQKGGMSIHDGIMPETNIINMMDEAIKILNDDNISLFVRVAIFHYLFGYIHPFYDGNGRMARFIASSYLCEGVDTLSALQLSICCKRYQKEYYDSFKITNDIRNKGDITFFVIQFLEIFKLGLIELLDKIQEQVNQYKHYYDIINNNTDDDKELRVLDSLLQVKLFVYDSITSSNLAYVCDMSKPTLRKYLDSEFAKKVVVCDTSSKENHYNLDLEELDKFKERSE